MTRQREWGSTGERGLFQLSTAHLAISDGDWELVQAIVKKKVGRTPPSEFRPSINSALRVWEDANDIYEKSKPAPVRDNLEAARAAAVSLSRRLDAVDGNGRQLLAEVPDGTIHRLNAATINTIRALEAALKKADDYGSTRGGVFNTAAQWMGYYLYWAIAWHLGEEHITATENGLYVQLYEVLARIIGAEQAKRGVKKKLSPYAKAARKALRFACERNIGEPEGPPRV